MTVEDDRQAFAEVTVHERVPPDLRDTVARLADEGRRLEALVRPFADELRRAHERFDALTSPEVDYDHHLAGAAGLEEVDVLAGIIVSQLQQVGAIECPTAAMRERYGLDTG
jgi:hypothetical protein